MGNCRTSVSFLSPFSTKYTLDLQVDSDLAPESRNGHRFLEPTKFLRTNNIFCSEKNTNDGQTKWTNQKNEKMNETKKEQYKIVRANFKNSIIFTEGTHEMGCSRTINERNEKVERAHLYL